MVNAVTSLHTDYLYGIVDILVPKRPAEGRPATLK